MPFLIVGCLSLIWDASPYSGMIRVRVRVRFRVRARGRVSLAMPLLIVG